MRRRSRCAIGLLRGFRAADLIDFLTVPLVDSTAYRNGLFVFIGWGEDSECLSGLKVLLERVGGDCEALACDQFGIAILDLCC